MWSSVATDSRCVQLTRERPGLVGADVSFAKGRIRASASTQLAVDLVVKCPETVMVVYRHEICRKAPRVPDYL